MQEHARESRRLVGGSEPYVAGEGIGRTDEHDLAGKASPIDLPLDHVDGGDRVRLVRQCRREVERHRFLRVGRYEAFADLHAIRAEDHGLLPSPIGDDRFRLPAEHR